MTELRFNIKTVSEANQRGHWATRYKRGRHQRFAFSVLWKHQHGQVVPPATITFTRYSGKTLDSDNLAGAFKAIRDQLAEEIGIDDGDLRIAWRYAQEQTKKRENYFTVRIENV